MGKKAVKLTVLFLAALAFLLGPCLSVSADKRTVDAVIQSIPDDWPEAPEVEISAGILIDADSGEILYAKRATEMMYPASTTKLMTALLALENASLTDVVTFSSKAVAIPAGSSHVGMRRGEKMVMKECLYALLLPSANEVANAIAEHVSGSISAFVAKMNERMQSLGAVNTVFLNTNGLHDPEHYTCAYDLAILMKELVENSAFVDIASHQSYVHHEDELLPKTIPMTNTDMMVRKSSEYYNEDVVCGKTGHTDESGYNLVTYATKDGIRLISVVLGAENGKQYQATEALLNYGFHSFSAVLPAELDASLNIENHFTSSALSIPTPQASILSLDSGDTILLPENVTFDLLKKQAVAGETGVTITYSYKEYPLGTIKLSYAKKESLPSIFTQDEETVGPKYVQEMNVIDGWLLLALLILAGAAVILIRRFVKRRMPRKTFK